MPISSVFTGRRYLYRNLKQTHLQRKPFYSLGRPLGYARDAFSLVFILFIVSIYCLPSVDPVTIQNFNWTPFFLAFVIGAILLGWYFHGRKCYGKEVIYGVSSTASRNEFEIFDVVLTSGAPSQGRN